MEHIIFKRKIYKKLVDWKRRSNGTTALMIEGARRVGKSTVAREFARQEYKSYILLDFSNVTPDIKNLFDIVANKDYFFLMLQTLTGVKLYDRESLIVFDEVQLYPPARQAIKHLVADGRYDYLETGSLISIKKNVKDILIPSEEERLYMFPMDFEEFLMAQGKEMTYELIKNAYYNKFPLTDDVHRRLMFEFRLYMLVGGMPQAVFAYMEKNNFEDVDIVKRGILHLYIEDFRKIDATGRASALFEAIPSELSRNTTRYKVGSVLANSRPERLQSILQEMKDSMTVNIAYHADDPGVGFGLHANPNFFKMFLGDTGLFVTLAFMDKDVTENIIYKKLLSDKLPADLGYLYENIVAQMLRAAGHNLFYYTFKQSDDNGKEKNYEIDFLLSHGAKIIPIEVKSSTLGMHRSISEFIKKYSGRIGAEYLISTKKMQKEGSLRILPVYMCPFIS